MTAKVAISAPAFYRRDALFAPIEWFTNQARRCGADGIEWRPCQLPLTALQIATGAISSEAKADILSVEESYRTEHSPREAWSHDNRKIAMYSYFLFPHKDDPLKDSLFGIRRLRRVLAREFPVTIYPELTRQQSARRLNALGFADILYQPHRYLLNAIEGPEEGKPSIWEFIDLIKIYSCSGINLDFTHLLEFADEFGGWENCVEVLLPYAKEIQIGLLRSDLGNVQTRKVSSQMCLDLIEGTHYSPIRAFLRYIQATKWQGVISLEIIPMALGLHQETITGLSKVIYSIRRYLT